MNEITEIRETKEECIKRLQEVLQYYINEEKNPFEEARMVQYIDKGLQQLREVPDGANIVMYDKEGSLIIEEDL